MEAPLSPVLAPNDEAASPDPPTSTTADATVLTPNTTVEATAACPTAAGPPVPAPTQAPAPGPAAVPTPALSITATYATAQSQVAGSSEPNGWFKEVLSRLKQQQRQENKDTAKVKSKGKDKEVASPPRKQEEDPAGMSSTTKDLYEGQPKCRCCINWVECPPKDTRMSEFLAKENIRHALVLRHKKNHDASRPPYALHSIKVQSPLLQDALGSVFEGYPGITTEMKDLIFKVPLRCFFHRMKELKAVLRDMENYEDQPAKVMATAEGAQDTNEDTTADEQILSEGRKRTIEHLKLLNSVVFEELEHTVRAHGDLTSKGIITFDLLWTLFPPGSLVLARYSPTDGDQIFKVEGDVMTDEKKRLCIPCLYIEWDGDKFGWATTILKISKFDGTKRIQDLTVVPLSFHPGRDDMERNLTERGRKWQGLAGVHCRVYEGRARCPDEKRSMFGLSPVLPASGRIMVDPKGYWEAIWWESQLELDPMGNCGSEDQTTSGDVQERQLTDAELMLCSSVVRGYSLTLKQWAVFRVDSIRDVEWSTGALEKLFLPDATKDTILTLVDTYMKGKVMVNDFVADKGQGISFLLTGPPGVGKTLTAEVAAEHFKTPLYSLSAGDLSDDTKRAERKIAEVFRLVEKWKAILLIENADVLLAQRTHDGSKTNQLVSVFLRMLEYHNGIIFLTTNKIDTIDQAAESRINVILEYPELSCQDRRSLWDNFATSCTIPIELNDADRDELAEMEMNGRQIRNTLKIAAFLAVGKGDTLTVEYVRKAMEVVCTRSKLRAASTHTEGHDVGSHEEGAVDGADLEERVEEQGDVHEDEEQPQPQPQPQEEEGEEREEGGGAEQERVQEDGVGEVDPRGSEVESCSSTVELKAVADGKRKVTWKRRWSKIRYGM